MGTKASLPAAHENMLQSNEFEFFDGNVGEHELRIDVIFCWFSLRLLKYQPAF